MSKYVREQKRQVHPSRFPRQKPQSMLFILDSSKQREHETKHIVIDAHFTTMDRIIREWPEEY